MQKTRLTKSLSLIVCVVLIAAMALLTIGCNDNTKETPEISGTSSAAEQSKAGDNVSQAVSGSQSSEPESNVLGEGKNHFTFKVVDADGKETVFEIRTDKTTVGEALQELELISGDEGPYGLYVKTVNGITVDYDTDGKYWAFYVNDAYGTSGADMTEIVSGATYAFKVE